MQAFNRIADRPQAWIFIASSDPSLATRIESEPFGVRASDQAVTAFHAGAEVVNRRERCLHRGARRGLPIGRQG
jgi:hypothetical protein